MLGLYDRDGEREPGPTENGERAAVRHVSVPAAAVRGTYRLVQKDPAPYREQIIAFWKEYLPGTPAGRFDWMSNGNPAGPALWFFAVDTRNDEIAGVISVIPREVIMGGRRVRAGILGDFMVSRRHRVFGPGLLLPKTAVAELSKRGFEMFYTIPNAESEKVIRRMGFRHRESLYSMVKPLEVGYYLEKYMNRTSARLLSPLIRNGLALLSMERYIPSRGAFGETACIGAAFDALWDKMCRKEGSLRGDRSAAYLSWRYLCDPLRRYRVLTYRKKPGGKMLGCLFFMIDAGRLHIADIMSPGIIPVYKLLRRIVDIAKQEGCLSLTIDVGRTNPLLSLVRSFGFFNAGKDIALFFLGGPEESDTEYGFVGGDRSL
ncbi:MAG: GNAT family N-acetyltransferase [Alphaproteobacteria bacterium]|uniref:GNAT family N-acetyltransferase n=1 Tax=Candidatus Nitrobium versatile TaxID=2884831 RepID=A0A953J3X5_9BACT|nr:GNAT family N-acetyltransferase [Candidatus Nitrobium versatile]